MFVTQVDRPPTHLLFSSQKHSWRSHLSNLYHHSLFPLLKLEMSADTPDTRRVPFHNDHILRTATTNLRKLATENPDIAHLSREAKDATQAEKSMTFSQAIHIYPKAVAWSVLLSTAIVMEGYDTTLLGQFFVFPKFAEQYGSLDPNSNPPTYQLTAAWQTGLQNGAQVGEILGLYTAGIVVDRVGYRKTMIGALFLMIFFIFIPFFSKNLATLLAGEILQGIPWGVFQTMTTAYASEVCPVALRAYLTTYVNLCWVFGQLIATGVLRALLTRNDQWAYRIPFAIQWVWPLPILIGVLFAPESPWWYIRKDRVSEAKRSLLRLATAGQPDFDVDKTIAMMVHTNEIEKRASKGTSYMDCFRGYDLRRTEIASMTWAAQTLCGSSMMFYSVYFFKSAGLNDSQAFNLGLGQYAMGAVGTIGSWFLMSHAGRRTLYLWGLIILFILLMIVGFLGIAHQDNGVSWTVGSMILIYNLVYGITIGPVCYSLVAEVPSTRLKAKTIVLARNFYNLTNIVVNIITPRMLNPTSWNWGAKTGFFWASICFLVVVWTFFRLPEPKGRTYGELDILFENRLPARKFSKTGVDQFSADHMEVVEEEKEKEQEDGS